MKSLLITALIVLSLYSCSHRETQNGSILQSVAVAKNEPYIGHHVNITDEIVTINENHVIHIPAGTRYVQVAYTYDQNGGGFIVQFDDGPKHGFKVTF
jgi:hypothetical protein